MGTVTPDLKLRRGELPFQVLADETIVVHPRTHEVHVLNETGSRLWELLSTERPVAELMAVIEEEFDAPVEELRADVLRFLDELLGKKLILARAGATTAGPADAPR